ncbi:MAG: aconitate hydratase AcnA [Deltaproteobacteria bacterium]|nr:aconitate hydratase AcnA [Deltaproteobacteria bacterium]
MRGGHRSRKADPGSIRSASPKPLNHTRRWRRWLRNPKGVSFRCVKSLDSFGSLAPLGVWSRAPAFFRLAKLEEDGIGRVSRLPFSVKILLEGLLRNEDGFAVTRDHVAALAAYDPAGPGEIEIPFKPARVLLQDFTGVPCLADLAAMRSAAARVGADPARINPAIPVDLVVDHSIQVGACCSAQAHEVNERREFGRNRERYEFLKWGRRVFENFRVVPPASGICHQINLEYLAKVVRDDGGVAFPDTVVGADSHTTMINGVGVLGWGVGGIEAEAAMLGQPLPMLAPAVVGVKFVGRMNEGVTATDLVLTLTEVLRRKGVVGTFVEFFGNGLPWIPVPDRATMANMAPEYGATVGFFPVDRRTLDYLRATGRPSASVDLVERYCRAQGLFRTDDTPDPVFGDTLEVDLGAVEPCLAGPHRPHERVPLRGANVRWPKPESDQPPAAAGLCDGAVVIAAIASCTATGNPSMMIAAGLLARNAVKKGLSVKPWVKTSLAPGSKVVTRYLEKAGLMSSLEALGFYVVGYGCTTCIGNSGPFLGTVEDVVRERDLSVVAVLSGNRNFEGRIHPLVKASYLASPPLVVAYAIAGTMCADLASGPLGTGADGRPVSLRDIWPTDAEIAQVAAASVRPEMFEREYEGIEDGNADWNAIGCSGGTVYGWRDASTFVVEPPFFADFSSRGRPVAPIEGARVLVMAGDGVTTDQISPAGDIDADSPAGRYLLDAGVAREDFNSYGSRRGNDRVMARGTFANVRFRNGLAAGTEGWYTTHFPTGQVVSIFEASERYRKAGTPLLVVAGKDYGMGSSRDWAAKGPMLLGVKAVIAESFERIHRSNLVGMGVLPLQFLPGEGVAALGFSGRESFTIHIDDRIWPKAKVGVSAHKEDGSTIEFETICRVDTPVEIEYFKNGGVMQTVLRKLLG